MINKYIAICCVSAIGLLSACAELGIVRNSVDAKTRTSMRSVAVASVIGSTLYLTHKGATVFNNEDYQADVSDWKVDETAIRTAISLMNGTGRLTATSIGSNYFQYDQNALFAEAARAGADTLIVIYPGTVHNLPFYKQGIGYLHQTFLGLPEPNGDCIYSLVLVHLFDVATRKNIAWQDAKSTFTGVPCYGAEKKIPWKPDFTTYSESEKSQLREVMLNGLTINVTTALKRLGVLDR